MLKTLSLILGTTLFFSACSSKEVPQQNVSPHIQQANAEEALKSF